MAELSRFDMVPDLVKSSCLRADAKIGFTISAQINLQRNPDQQQNQNERDNDPHRTNTPAFAAIMHKEIYCIQQTVIDELVK